MLKSVNFQESHQQQKMCRIWDEIKPVSNHSNNQVATRVSARRLSIYNFVWGLLKATKKVYLMPQKRKINKNTYGIYPTKLAGSTQNHKKKYWNTKSTNQKQKISNKIMLSTSKVKRN
jgi:hypothetical protein